jgi:hypothetical protein
LSVFRAVRRFTDETTTTTTTMHHTVTSSGVPVGNWNDNFSPFNYFKSLIG